MRGKFVADGSGELHSGGISVAGGCVVEWGAAGAGKKERRQEKSDATLFLYEESGYRKSILQPHRIRLHRQERGQMGDICT